MDLSPNRPPQKGRDSAERNSNTIVFPTNEHHCVCGKAILALTRGAAPYREMDRTESSRIGLFDAMKGVAIVLMVAGHAGMPAEWTRFVYLFHMAVFLMLSGLFHRDPLPADIGGFWSFLRRKLKALWVPYAFWMALFAMLHDAFVHLCVYSADPVFLSSVRGAVSITCVGIAETVQRMADALIFRGKEQVGGAFWFLAVLFQIAVLSGLSGFFLDRVGFGRRKRFLQTILAAALLFLGFRASVRGFRFLMLDIAFSGFFLYHLGVLAAPWRKRIAEAGGLVLFVSFAAPIPILLRLSRIGAVSLVSNHYPDPVFLLVASVSGWLLVLGTAGILFRVPYAKRILQVLGRHSMEVLVFHFLAFKLVSAAGVLALGRPFCLIAAFPVLFRGGWWWLAYTVVGVSVPVVGSIALTILWRKLRGTFDAKASGGQGRAHGALGKAAVGE